MKNWHLVKSGEMTLPRLKQLEDHLKPSDVCAFASVPSSAVVLRKRPASLSDSIYTKVLSPPALNFLQSLYEAFQPAIANLYHERQARQLQKPAFDPLTKHIRQSKWTIDALPKELHRRYVDIGDISPAITSQFLQAFNSRAQGIQADLDDGHCPTWHNSILALYNLKQASHEVDEFHSNNSHPVLLVRPRAWNMHERNVLIHGAIVPGPVFDFALHMFHNAHVLHQKARGPYFYLSKLESWREARVWNEIFTWTEDHLKLAPGSIKACVLIENIHAAFEMDEILYELRTHSLGLNCGMWDYAASIISKFHDNRSYVLPDRQTYVSMQSPFMKTYMQLVIETCHRRKAPATTGMIPFVITPETNIQTLQDRVRKAKTIEAQAGADGALIYDLAFIDVVQEIFLHRAPTNTTALYEDPDLPSKLLQLPKGDITLSGVQMNVKVGLLFIQAWLQGQGTFIFNGAVEDSATAEISRSQLWQWIRYECAIADQAGQHVTGSLVYELIQQAVAQELEARSPYACTAGELLWQIVISPVFIRFITTFLSEQRVWMASQDH